MKKKLRFLALFLSVVFVLPITFLFVGCGATPSNEVKAVYFDSPEYDEETNYAVFEVDVGTTKLLDYKVNPSTWSGYRVSYAIKKCSPQNQSRFKLENGEITVYRADFEEIWIEININNKTDTCIVKLKEYPVSIVPDESEITINAYGSADIRLKGYFTDGYGETTVRYIDENEFNFSVVSGDDTEIDIPNPGRLKLYSIRPYAVSNIPVTITINDMSGESKGIKCEIKVNVVRNAEYSLVFASGYNKIINDGDEIEINLANLEQVDDKYQIEFTSYAFGESGKWIREDEIISIEVNSRKYCRVDDGKILIDSDVVDGARIGVSMNSKLTKNDGTTFVTNFIIIVKK